MHGICGFVTKKFSDRGNPENCCLWTQKDVWRITSSPTVVYWCLQVSILQNSLGIFQYSAHFYWYFVFEPTLRSEGHFRCKFSWQRWHFSQELMIQNVILSPTLSELPCLLLSTTSKTPSWPRTLHVTMDTSNVDVIRIVYSMIHTIKF